MRLGWLPSLWVTHFSESEHRQAMYKIDGLDRSVRPGDVGTEGLFDAFSPSPALSRSAPPAPTVPQDSFRRYRRFRKSAAGGLEQGYDLMQLGLKVGRRQVGTKLVESRTVALPELATAPARARHQRRRGGIGEQFYELHCAERVGVEEPLVVLNEAERAVRQLAVWHLPVCAVVAIREQVRYDQTVDKTQHRAICREHSRDFDGNREAQRIPRVLVKPIRNLATHFPGQGYGIRIIVKELELDLVGVLEDAAIIFNLEADFTAGDDPTSLHDQLEVGIVSLCLENLISC